ncbi:15894_t:CDS:1, partial [Funneliformis geosporum]
TYGFLINENSAGLVLKAIKMMNVDDPAIFVQWDARGFNDTTTENCRNGVARQTLTANESFRLYY